MEWNTPVQELKGIGEQRQKKLQKLDIFTIEDLLTHYPREYKDRSEIIKIADLVVVFVDHIFNLSNVLRVQIICINTNNSHEFNCPF